MGELRVDDRAEGVLVGTFDNPPHGLMDRGSVAGLERLVARAEADDGVRAVVLTGAHPERFVAHYDVGEILAGARESPAVGTRAAAASARGVAALRKVPGGESALARTPAAGLAEAERFGELFLRMNRCGAVFVAAVNGSAMGGGCELALACDQRLMAAGDHGIGQPEVLLGFPPGGGGTQRLARLLGTGPALRIVLDGGPVGPDRALELGLVDEVVAAGELLDRAIEVARRLGRRPKAAVAACKRAIYEGASLPLERGLRAERAEFMSTVARPEAIAAMTAYVEGIESGGELPAYDRDRLTEVLERGSFD